MTDDQINRLIAEERRWKPSESALEAVKVWKEVSGETIEPPPPNYIEKYRLTHELIEVLRGEGWRLRITAMRGGGWDVVADDKFHSINAYNSEFCRTVCECFLKVRGKWKD